RLVAARRGEDRFALQRRVTALVTAPARVRRVPEIRLSVVPDPSALLGRPIVEEALGRGYSPTWSYGDSPQDAPGVRGPTPRVPARAVPAQRMPAQRMPAQPMPARPVPVAARLVFLGEPAPSGMVARDGGVCGRGNSAGPR